MAAASSFFVATTTLVILISFIMARPSESLMPYSRSSLWDMIQLPDQDPFRILEQTPLTIPKGMESSSSTSLALARADWKETPNSHVITLDLPGMKKEDVKIEVEENRVLRISGERKSEQEEVEGDKWHRAERTCGKFWRQFRLPGNADLDKINASLQDGLLTVIVPKLADENKRQAKVITIVDDKPSSSSSSSSSSSAHNIEPTKASA